MHFEDRSLQAALSRAASLLKPVDAISPTALVIRHNHGPPSDHLGAHRETIGLSLAVTPISGPFDCGPLFVGYHCFVTNAWGLVRQVSEKVRPLAYLCDTEPQVGKLFHVLLSALGRVVGDEDQLLALHTEQPIRYSQSNVTLSDH